MNQEELDGAKRFQDWMDQEEIRMKSIVLKIPDQVDGKRLPMFREPIKKPDFEFKRPGQLSLF